jgi:hypothetical protein
MSNISQARRNAYRVARALGNAEAIQRSVKTGSPAPIVKRALRRSAYRSTNRTLSRVLRSLGL